MTAQVQNQAPLGSTDRSWDDTPSRAIPRWHWLVAGVVGVTMLFFASHAPPATRTAPGAMIVPTVQPARGPNLGGAAPSQREGLTTSLTSIQAQDLEDEFRRGYSAFGPSPSTRGQPVSSSQPRVRMINQSLAPPPDAPEVVRDEWRMLNTLNEARIQNGLAPVAPDDSLADIARWRSDDMAARNYFSHDIGGFLVFQVLKDAGYSYRVAGENLAYNYFPAQDSVVQAHLALMNSPSHRANILRADFTRAAIGVAVVADGRRIYTQLFSTPFEAQISPVRAPAGQGAGTNQVPSTWPRQPI